jgi:type I site-specific restriction endonuclease
MSLILAHRDISLRCRIWSLSGHSAGKTLIFAVTDAHADIVVAEIKKAFAKKYGEIDDATAKKIIGSVDRVGTLIRSFRNDADPRIAVTVDLLTTGIDVPSITNLAFLRRVNSRILYEQQLAARVTFSVGFRAPRARAAR